MRLCVYACMRMHLFSIIYYVLKFYNFDKSNKMKVLKLITALTIIKHNNFFDSIVQRDLHVDNCNFSIEEALKLGVWVQDIHIFSL
jgi:hypothetical protein